MLLIFRFIWHIWSLLVILLLTLIFATITLTILTIVQLKGKKALFWWYKFLGMLWANIILSLMGIYIKTEWKYKPKKNQTYIIVGNHASFLDIFVLFSKLPFPFTFIGKKQLGKLPIFRQVYKKMVIYVDRDSRTSKKEVFAKTIAWLKEGYSICIFPEGGIPKYDTKLAPFKNGPFLASIETGLPLLPVAFLDNGRLFPYSFKKGGIGISRMKVLDAIYPENLTMEEIKEKTFKALSSELN